MKRGFIDKWTNVSGCQNLLFFAQLLNELIFDYSIPSNRLATLNSHYLCLDAMSAISDVEQHGVPEGTIKPIVEELYNSLCKDHAFDLSETKPSDLFIKQEANTFKKIYNTKDLNFDDSKKIVTAIYYKYFNENAYFELIKVRIIEIVERNNTEEQDVLLQLTKSFVTELVNSGYSNQYIYDQMTYSFFNKKVYVDKPQDIHRFTDSFDFKQKEYSVLFIANKSYSNIVGKYDMYSIQNQILTKTQLELEKTYLKKEDDENYFVVNSINALDQYTAIENVISILDIQISFYRLNNHNDVFDTSKLKWCVYDKANYFSIYKRPKNSVKKAKTVSAKLIDKNIEKVNIATSLAIESDVSYGHALISAVTFHSLSIDASSKENQLLDLWAIFETLLDISQKHTGDRIQQVIKYLIPVLKQKYLFSLFEQLSNDIKNYSEKIYDYIVDKNTDTPILAITEFCLLEDNEAKRNYVFSQLDDFPLLKERICYYNRVLKTNNDVFEFVLKHTQRLEWQIMRIYRNRNLVIHNGRSMPYLPLLIENLHSYVDEFLKFIIDGFISSKNKDLIFQELFVKECEWVRMMTQNKSKKAKENIDNKLITYILS